MNPPFPFRCPYCNRDTTIVAENFSLKFVKPAPVGVRGDLLYELAFTVCPNPECGEHVAGLSEYPVTWVPHAQEWSKTQEEPFHRWPLLPASRARPYPAFVPVAIRNDYAEACAIVALSPKASATLSRRALQGIMREFYGAKPGRLVDEIKQVETSGLVEPDIIEAIDAVRKVGNVGAHMESDINVIVEIDEGEADSLISLVELLIDETYIRREERTKRISGVKAVAAAKKI